MIRDKAQIPRPGLHTSRLWLKLRSSLVQIQLLTAEDKCMSLSTLRGEHFMPHAQPLRVELNRLWDIPGREHDVIDGLDREAGSHVAIPSWDDSSTLR